MSLFAKTFRLCTNREPLLKTLIRDISKTSSATNSDTVTTSSSRQSYVEYHEAVSSVSNKKWAIINRHNNNRALSTLQTKAKSSVTASIVSKDEAREFMAIFPDIVRDLTDAGRHTDIPEVNRRFAKLLQYVIPNGKKLRGLASVAAYKMLEDPEKLTTENVRLANVLGWAIELLQGFFVVVDDLIDGSDTRRGSPCWYKVDDTGTVAANDGILIENGMYSLLRRNFSQHPCYVPLIELFHDIVLKTAMGQSLDCLTANKQRKNLDLYTMNRYNSIVKYKTAYYSFYLPVGAAMLLAGKNDPEMHRQAKTILLEMGHFFQVQDDFLDCFGDPSVTGKVGTDIAEGKCSWLIVVALQRANDDQRKVLEEHYGKADPASVNIVKNLYEELSLPNTYAIYEEESFNLMKTHIQQVTRGLPHKLFFTLMEKLYKREA